MSARAIGGCGLRQCFLLIFRLRLPVSQAFIITAAAHCVICSISRYLSYSPVPDVGERIRLPGLLEVARPETILPEVVRQPEVAHLEVAQKEPMDQADSASCHRRKKQDTSSPRSQVDLDRVAT